MDKYLELGIAAIAAMKASIYTDGNLEEGMQLTLDETEPWHYENPESDYAITSATRTKNMLHKQARLVSYAIMQHFKKEGIAISIENKENVVNNNDFKSSVMDSLGSYPRCTVCGEEIDEDEGRNGVGFCCLTES